MILSWPTFVLLAVGLAFLTLAGWLAWRRPPSVQRLEGIVYFSSMGIVCLVLGTAVVFHEALLTRNANDELTDTILGAAVLACLPLFVIGYPLVRWWVLQHYRRQAEKLDYAEDRRGNPIVADRLPEGGRQK